MSERGQRLYKILVWAVIALLAALNRHYIINVLLVLTMNVVIFVLNLT